MVTLETYIQELYRSFGLDSSHERRKTLIKEMELLEGKTVHCFTCPGTCCTYKANSMQITPIEALEILHSLRVDILSSSAIKDLKERLKNTVGDFRLGIEIYTGKKNSSSLRKNYTCPFFNNGSLGCGLSRSSKPYGCLGFNPKSADDNGQTCASNTELLSSREESFLSLEDKTNAEIRKQFKLSWVKQNIPMALLDILDHLYN